MEPKRHARLQLLREVSTKSKKPLFPDKVVRLKNVIIFNIYSTATASVSLQESLVMCFRLSNL